jgi:aspartate/methionine/tyrosine aminotransferase
MASLSPRTPFHSSLKVSSPIMNFHVSPQVASVEAPPIAEAMSWVRQGERNRLFLNLCQAVPSYPPAPELQSEFARLAMTDGIGGYTNIYGLDALRVAHAATMSVDYEGKIIASQVAITTGCNQAFAAAIMSVAEAGDNIVMPSPWYFNHSVYTCIFGRAKFSEC